MTSSTVNWSKGRASSMFWSVAFRSLISDSILSDEACACSTWAKHRREQLVPACCLGSAGPTHRLGLKRINGLDVSSHVIRHWLKVLENFLGLIHNRLVLERALVERQVNVCPLLLEHRQVTPCILGTLSERLNGRRGVLAQSQAGRREGRRQSATQSTFLMSSPYSRLVDTAPVDLCRGHDACCTERKEGALGQTASLLQRRPAVLVAPFRSEMDADGTCMSPSLRPRLFMCQRLAWAGTAVATRASPSPRRP